MSSRRLKFPWPHYVDHENKQVFVYIASGFPTVMAAPIKVKEFYPGYETRLCKNESYLEEMRNAGQS